MVHPIISSSNILFEQLENYKISDISLNYMMNKNIKA